MEFLKIFGGVVAGAVLTFATQWLMRRSQRSSDHNIQLREAYAAWAGALSALIAEVEHFHATQRVFPEETLAASEDARRDFMRLQFEGVALGKKAALEAELAFYRLLLLEHRKTETARLIEWQKNFDTSLQTANAMETATAELEALRSQVMSFVCSIALPS